MKTKVRPIREKDLPRYVKAEIEGIIAPHETSRISGKALQIPFQAEVEWEERPTVLHPHWTKVIFYGATRFAQGFAHYRGQYGEWQIDLAPWNGPIETIEEAQSVPCTRTWGTAHCIKASDEWRETQEQRRARIQQWIDEGIL
jgi:hypothetical protein